jgi:hypothetical protein
MGRRIRLSVVPDIESVERIAADGRLAAITIYPDGRWAIVEEDPEDGGPDDSAR